jgi:hypothetical protein
MGRFRTEDWVVTFLSVPLLIISGLATYLPNNGFKVPSALDSVDAWINIGAFFVIALILLFVGNKVLGRPLRGLLVSFIFIFAVAVLAQWVATFPKVKYFGLEAVFFSVLFGLLIRNIFHIPE